MLLIVLTDQQEALAVRRDEGVTVERPAGPGRLLQRPREVVPAVVPCGMPSDGLAVRVELRRPRLGLVAVRSGVDEARRDFPVLGDRPLGSPMDFRIAVVAVGAGGDELVVDAGRC